MNIFLVLKKKDDSDFHWASKKGYTYTHILKASRKV